MKIAPGLVKRLAISIGSVLFLWAAVMTGYFFELQSTNTGTAKCADGLSYHFCYGLYHDGLFTYAILDGFGIVIVAGVVVVFVYLITNFLGIGHAQKSQTEQPTPQDAT